MDIVSWQSENKVIRVSNSRVLTSGELIQLNDAITSMLDSGDAPVHLIYEAGNFKTPTNISEVKGALTFLQHPSLGWIITINTNRVINFISMVVTNLSKINLKSAANTEEALIILSKVDPSLTKTGVTD